MQKGDKTMFGKRVDGTKVKIEDPLMRIVPHIMDKRNDAQNMYLIEERAEVLDEFIQKQREQNNVSYNYMHILYAILVRVLKERPRLNRFIMDGVTYQRDFITLSMSVKKALKDSAEETTMKVPFKGNENIFEVKQIVDSYIKEAQKIEETSKGVDAAMAFFNSLPNWLIKFLVAVVKWADRKGMMPAWFIGKYGFSPFHTSAFITNLKSIRLNYLYHHLYNFGTTGIFISLGKENYEPVVNEETNEIEVGKVLKMGFVSDERFVDGLYYSNTLKLVRKYLNNPELLLENPNEWTPTKNELKQDKAYLKQQEKLRKKQQKKELKLSKKQAKLEKKK